MIIVRDNSKRESRLAARYTKAVEAHERIERELARVQNRWQKSRAALKRMEKKLDQEFNHRADAPARILDDSMVWGDPASPY